MDNRLEAVRQRMLDSGISEEEINALIIPLQEALEFRVCGLARESGAADSDLIPDPENKRPVLIPDKDRNIITDITGNGNSHLLIEGENLLALMAMQYIYTDGNNNGTIDVIYIDPPYNTGNITFDYNDRYEKSEWLSMMNVRLRLAKDLLADDGMIFVQIDEELQAELKLLLNEIFGEEHFINCICVKMSELSGVKMTHTEKRLPKVKEYVYAYGMENTTIRPVIANKSDDPEKFEKYLKYYSRIIENPGDKPEEWNIMKLKDYLRKYHSDIDPKDEQQVREFKLTHAERMVYRTNNKSFDKDMFPGGTHEVTSAEGIRYIWWEGKQMLFLSDHTSGSLGDLWTDISTINLNKEGGVDFRNGKKPLKLLKRLLGMINKDNITVLDFFAGSGSTAQAVLEMNDEDGQHRRFILCNNNELGEDAVKAAEKAGAAIGSLEWESFGVCRSRTYPRMKNIFEGRTGDNLYYYRVSV